MSMPLPLDGDTEDLPRTLRREKEAREREKRERAAREREAQPSGLSAPQPEPTNYTASYPYASAAYAMDEPYPASVRAIDVPFFRLMLFFIKAVFAAIPALVILMALLWLAGQALEAAFPELLKAKILITFPNS